MLDALSDFWRPMKKNQQADKLKPEQLQVGSSVGFGFVPQANLSGRRLTVGSINTYQFGEESLTSFVLSQDSEAGVSMIVAESEGEQYLAISRRISIGDRMKLCDSAQLDSIVENPENSTLICKDNVPDFKGWLVTSYKREIMGLAGRIYKGDYRKQALPSPSQAEEFKYTLLVSESNEQAIEIEKYSDGRMEVYATIYRRMSDIGEVSHPGRADASSRPDLKLASMRPEEVSKVVQSPAPKLVAEPEKPGAATAAPEVIKIEPEVKAAPLTLQEFTKATPLAAPEPKPEFKAEMKTETTKISKEIKPMANETATNGAASKVAAIAPQMSAYDPKPEIKTMNKMNMSMDNDAIECELKVANKIIDEAIRNEMRLSDVVRRVIELPVAHQEAVHIPITLSDDDYSLLAIRYGVTASDKNAIKKRIIEDLNNFSGKKAA